VYHAPYPDVYRSGLSPDATADRCIDFIEGELFVHLVAPDEVAAIVVEAIQGEAATSFRRTASSSGCARSRRSTASS